MDDRQLLQEYAERGSEQAFREIVDRYLGLVHAAARRQMNDAQGAQDVSQAVFLLLARKAGQLAKGTRLSGWLYQTTCFVAQRALRSEIRRRERERIASDMHLSDSHPAENTWNALAPHLDAAMARLGEQDRQALLIRFFEKRSHRDVAAALGLSEEAAKKRTHRAVERLRGILGRYGISVSGVTLETLLGEHSVEAASPALAASIHALAGTTAGTSGTAAAVERLVEGTWQAWRWTRWAWVAGASVVGVAIMTWVGMLLSGERGLRSENPSALRAATEQNIASLSTAAVGRTPAADTRRVLVFRVVDRATGEGVPEARLAIQSVVQGDWHNDFDQRTDASGFAEIRYPADTARMDVGIFENGWVARYASFRPFQDDAIPAEYTLRVVRSTTTMGGWVRDEDGQPVVGATIRIAFDGTGDSSIQETPRERVGCPIWRAPVATTGTEGRWSMTITAPGPVGYSLTARHPDFAERPVGGVLWEKPNPPVPDRREEGSGLGIMRRGALVTGRVLGTDGLPVEGASISLDPFSMEPTLVRTDADGRFQLPRMDGRDVELTVMAEGRAPVVRSVDVSSGMAPLEIVLEPGGVLRLRLVDEDGEPVSGGEVVLEQWKDHRHLVKWSARSDADGRIAWDGAPTEGELEVCARGPGWCYTRGIRVTPGVAEHRIVLRRERRVSGRVVDARSGRPLAEFKVFPGYGWHEHDWERLDTRRGTDGRFEVVFSERKDPWRVRVEAEGYVPFVSEALDPKGTDVVDVRLERVDPGAEVVGVVIGADGKPAAGVEVALLTLEHDVRLNGRALMRRENDELIVTADAAGAFRFPGDAAAHSVAAVDTNGFGWVYFGTSRERLVVNLKPWGRIEGVVDGSARRRPVRQLLLMDPSLFGYRGCVHLGDTQSRTSMDADGRFLFEDVPPMDYVVCIDSGMGQAFHHKTPVSVPPGETVQVRVTSQGPTIRGRFVVTAGNGKDANAAVGPIQPAYLVSLNPPPPPDRPHDFARTREAVEYWRSAAGRAWGFRGVNVGLQIGSDGSFETKEEFPPGEYRLRAWVGGRAAKLILVVREPQEGESVLDLGEMVLAAPTE